MIEAQLINRVLTTKSLSLLILNNIDEEFFIEHQEPVKFIFEHYRKYNCVPDRETFFERFEDFPSIEVADADKYLIDGINESYLYSKTVPIINKTIELAQTDANEAIEYIVAKAPELTLRLALDGVDIMKKAESRLLQHNEMKETSHMIMTSTGLPEFDKLMYGGWLAGEELVTIVARPNQGKSWVLELLASSAWSQNKKVGFYSGEMSPNIVGYRVDTWLKHFSNTALMTGSFKDSDNYDEYKDYINMIKESPIPFIVITRKELGGKATVSKLSALVEKYDLDILFIDQYSLMFDERKQKGDARKDELGHISDDLMALSIKYKIPVVGAVQASRDGARKKGEEGESLTPELEHIADSDQIAQNSSRVISIRQIDDTLELCKRKDRYFGKIDESVMYKWAIDVGNLVYIPGSTDSYSESKFARPTAGNSNTQEDTDVF